MSAYPHPLRVDFFYNRTGRTVEQDNILEVVDHRTEDARERADGVVALRVIRGGPPNTVIECEVCLPHALCWRRSEL